MGMRGLVLGRGPTPGFLRVRLVERACRLGGKGWWAQGVDPGIFGSTSAGHGGPNPRIFAPALKNAARHHESNVPPSQKSEQLKNSEDFYKWARDRSGRATPKKTLGPWLRREAVWHLLSLLLLGPVWHKGTGAVSRPNLPKLECESTSKLHDFVDIGVAGKVSSCRAACHTGGRAGNRHECENLEFTGRPTHLPITRKRMHQRQASSEWSGQHSTATGSHAPRRWRRAQSYASTRHTRMSRPIHGSSAR